MITRDFAERTRLRIAETRAIIAKLRETNREAIKQLTKIDKQHDADRTKVYDRLGQLADDVVEKLPEEATDADSERAYALQEQINDVAADVEEVSLAGSTLEDLSGLLKDAFDDLYTSLKSAETQIVKVERAGTKLGI
jgi:hypothetical protein